MNAEQCSVDSLLQKNRAETFARQLQCRLRTLSGESEGDGLEDTSWNGDQLSSSSDNDIYYDLDSSPGSPAEEATETHFTEFINIKNSDSIYPSSSGAEFLNRELPFNKNDCQYSGQIYRTDNVNSCKNNSLDNNCFSFNGPEKDFASCSKCLTNQNFDGVSLPQFKENSPDNVSSSCVQNGFLESSQFNEDVNRINKTEYSKDIKNFTNASPEVVDGNSLIVKTNEPTSDSKRICGTKCKTQEITSNESNYETGKNNENKGNYNNCCTCFQHKNSKSVDINCNSSDNNSNKNCDSNSDSKATVLEMTPQVCGSPSINKELFHRSNFFSSLGKSSGDSSKDKLINQIKNKEGCENEGKSELNNIKNGSVQYTEDDLCRLVDAVFSKSQDEDYDSSKVECERNDGKPQVNKSDEDEEEIESIESKRSKFRRCSSLKTGKTPPGTPGCKKIVRFADVLGLDLADVRTFLDEIPKVPKSAFVDLKNVEFSSSPPIHSSLLDYMGQCSGSSTSSKSSRIIVPLFQQPSSRPDFLDRVRDYCVCLENALVSDISLSVITGIVRVKNIDFHKSVHIRYSIDNWKSFADLQAKYIPQSCDGFSDKFSFTLYAHMLNVGQKLEFAVRYHAKGSLYWDNNLGANYIFQCVLDSPTKFSPSSYIMPSPTETWAAFY